MTGFKVMKTNGRGALVPRRVTRVYRNTTTEWLRLTWAEDGEAKELVTTPGHHFLDRQGRFTRIDRMLEDDRATIVLANGTLTEVRAERILYSAETAHQFERAVAFIDTGDGTAAKPAELDCSSLTRHSRSASWPLTGVALESRVLRERMVRMACHSASSSNRVFQQTQGKQEDAV